MARPVGDLPSLTKQLYAILANANRPSFRLIQPCVDLQGIDHKGLVEVVILGQIEADEEERGLANIHFKVHDVRIDVSTGQLGVEIRYRTCIDLL